MIHKKKAISKVISNKNGIRTEHYNLPKSFFEEGEANVRYQLSHYNPDIQNKKLSGKEMLEIMFK